MPLNDAPPVFARPDMSGRGNLRRLFRLLKPASQRRKRSVIASEARQRPQLSSKSQEPSSKQVRMSKLQTVGILSIGIWYFQLSGI